MSFTLIRTVVKRGQARSAQWRDAMRTQLWPLPAAGVMTAVVLGIGLPRVDGHLDGGLPPWLTDYLFGGGPSAARAVLEAIATSLITVTSLTFSLTVVTLQLASGQFSPRLLRTFTRDRFVHATLALFLGTFTYALTVLRTVRDATQQAEPFVPQIAVTVAFVLALGSVLGLVLFLAHLAKEIRVETMLQKVHRDASRCVDRVLGTQPAAAEDAVLPVPPPDAQPLVFNRSGILLDVDQSALFDAALATDAIVSIDRYPGSDIVAATPVGRAWARTGDRLDGDALKDVQNAVQSGIGIGFERTDTQDVAYGLRQLVDVANKALSPGINDPTTAVHALGHVSSLLCQLARVSEGPVVLRDQRGEIRVVLQRPDFADLLENAMTQPQRYGAADPFVMDRLFNVLKDLAWTAQGADQRAAISAHLERLRQTAATQAFDTTTNAKLTSVARQVDAALAGHWTAGD